MDMAPIEVLLMILYVYLYEHDALYSIQSCPCHLKVALAGRKTVTEYSLSCSFSFVVTDLKPISSNYVPDDVTQQ
jgi:hypothetical protein